MSRDLRLDHVLTYIPGRDLDGHLDKYRATGFHIDPYRNRTLSGVETGFVQFGYESLEFFSVQDDAGFATYGGAMPCDPILRQVCRPFALGLRHPDVTALHREMAARGITLPEPYGARDRDVPDAAPPTWRYIILDHLLPGLAIFAITYGNGVPRHPLPPSANGLKRLRGVILVADDPQSRADTWKSILFPEAELRSYGMAVALDITDGVLWWLTPEDFAMRYGRIEPFPHRYGEFGAVILEGPLLDAGRGLAATPCHLPDGLPAAFIQARHGDGLAMIITG